MKKICSIVLFLVIGYMPLHGLDEIPSTDIPEDFKVIATSGSITPIAPIYKIEIDSEGNGVYSIISKEKRAKGIFEEINRFKLNESALRLIHGTVEDGKFFELNSRYIKESIRGGSFAELTIARNGKTHKVRTENTALAAFDDIMLAINITTPPDNKMIYNEILK